MVVTASIRRKGILRTHASSLYLTRYIGHDGMDRMEQDRTGWVRRDGMGFDTMRCDAKL